MNRLTYTLLLYAALPLLPLRLLWRARRQRGYLRHWRERFGFYVGHPRTKPLVWIHAVSVGETRAAEPLVRVLRERYPHHRILITHMTPTGRETGELLYGDRVERCYLPYDYPGAVRRFLAHYGPVVGALMETEIWPNLIAACATRGVPLYLVNARLSEKSFGRYHRHKALASAALRGLSGIAAQTAADARRFAQLGAAQPVVTGNLKFDVTPPPDMLKTGGQWRAAFGRRPVLLAASTRAGEEELVMRAFMEAAVPDALLVLVPRHPDRCDEIAALLQRRGVQFQRRSAGIDLRPETQVLIGDSLGEMFAYYAACDVAVMGGSLLAYGSQNLIEACAVGKPLVLGTSTYNFAEAAELALASGAAREVANADELAIAIRELLNDVDAARSMGRAGLAFARAHQGAARRLVDFLRF